MKGIIKWKELVLKNFLLVYFSFEMILYCLIKVKLRKKIGFVFEMIWYWMWYEVSFILNGSCD